MTTRQNDILHLIRASYLDAIVLAFLGIQFVIPVAYFLLLPIVPAMIALQVFLVSTSVVLVSAGILIGLSFFILGVDVGLWTVVYVITGCALGMVWRSGSSWIIRALVTTAAAAASLLGVIIALSCLTNIGLAEIAQLAQGLAIFEGRPLASLFGVSLLLIGFLIWGVSDQLVSRVLDQLGDLQKHGTNPDQ